MRDYQEVPEYLKANVWVIIDKDNGKEHAMSKVVAIMFMSLDGYVADLNKRKKQTTRPLERVAVLLACAGF